MQDYLSGKPFFKDVSERERQAPRPRRHRDPSAEEVELLKHWEWLWRDLRRRGTNVRALAFTHLAYLPYDRTVQFVVSTFNLMRTRRRLGKPPRHKGLDGTDEMRMDGVELGLDDTVDLDMRNADQWGLVEADGQGIDEISSCDTEVEEDGAPDGVMDFMEAFRASEYF